MGNIVSDSDLIWALERKLGQFSSEYYKETSGTSAQNTNVVQKYHAIYHCLRALGWNGGIDVDCELPDELMPSEYLEKREQARQEYEESQTKKQNSYLKNSTFRWVLF